MTLPSVSQIVQNPAGFLKDVKSKISNAAAGAEDFVRANPVTSGVTLAGTAAAGITAVQIIRKKKASSSSKKKSKKSTKKKSTKKKKRITHTSRGWKQDRARRSKQKWEVAYQRRKKKKSGKKTKKKVGKIYYTKRGQPYKILSSGKAKFIKGRKKK